MRTVKWSARSPRSMSRLRICCVVHPPSGLVVTPRMCTVRVATSRTKNTYNRRSVMTASTWKKSQANRVDASVRRNVRHVV